MSKLHFKSNVTLQLTPHNQSEREAVTHGTYARTFKAGQVIDESELTDADREAAISGGYAESVSAEQEATIVEGRIQKPILAPPPDTVIGTDRRGQQVRYEDPREKGPLTGAPGTREPIESTLPLGNRPTRGAIEVVDGLPEGTTSPLGAAVPPTQGDVDPASGETINKLESDANKNKPPV